MRAVLVEAFGGPEVLRVVEVPDPSPGKGQVLIAVEAAGVNRADALTRAGKYHRGGQPPVLLGLEAAGTVTALGEGVHGFRVGQQVLAMGAANQIQTTSLPGSTSAPTDDRTVEAVTSSDNSVGSLRSWWSRNRICRCGGGPAGGVSHRTSMLCLAHPTRSPGQAQSQHGSRSSTS